MESLVDPTETEFRLRSVIWPILAFIFFLIAIVMTALFLWMILKPETPDQSKSLPSIVRPNIDSPCPTYPPLFPLPIPLPRRVKKAADNINAHLADLVKSDQEENANKSALSIKIIYQNTTLLNGNYGSKTFKGALTPDDETRYRIGSVTKLFPVLLLFKLYDDGVITSLDDPLNKYAPDFSIQNPFGMEYNITLRQIANQMSGLPREAPCGYRCVNTTTAEQLTLLKSQYLVVKPWTIPSYSNLGYALLGRILTENLLNTTFESWVKEKILLPLGMKNTGHTITKAVKNNMALPYFPNGTVMPFMHLGWAGPAGEMYSTTSDLMKLAQVFLYPEKQSLLKPQTVREMLLSDFITSGGFWLWGSPFEMRYTNHFVARQKGGNIETYNTVFSVIPELKLAMAAVVNNAIALKYQASTCFKVADFVHKALIPALNQSLFEMKASATFPIPSKPFLGRFKVTQISMLTGKAIVVYASIVESKGVLELIPEIPILRNLGFILNYVGNPLVFQGFASSAVNASCVTTHLGMYGDVIFDKPGADGLSKYFESKSWKVSGVRVQNAREPINITQKESASESVDSLLYSTLS